MMSRNPDKTVKEKILGRIRREKDEGGGLKVV
jgi:hypothetical protein